MYAGGKKAQKRQSNEWRAENMKKVYKSVYCNQYAEEISKTCNQLAEDGWEVISIIAIHSLLVIITASKEENENG